MSTQQASVTDQERKKDEETLKDSDKKEDGLIAFQLTFLILSIYYWGRISAGRTLIGIH